MSKKLTKSRKKLRKKKQRERERERENNSEKNLKCGPTNYYNYGSNQTKMQRADPKLKNAQLQILNYSLFSLALSLNHVMGQNNSRIESAILVKLGKF